MPHTVHTLGPLQGDSHVVMLIFSLTQSLRLVSGAVWFVYPVSDMAFLIWQCEPGGQPALRIKFMNFITRVTD